MSNLVRRTFSQTVEPLKYDPMKRRKIKAKTSKTTLQKLPDGPFPRSKNTTLVYENALTSVAPAAALVALGTKPNSAYDYDNSSGAAFGNKQPLYYDALLTASGPYKNYKVNSWKTTYTIVNMTEEPLTVFAMPPLSATSEIDSLAEADNFPGVKRLYLTGKSGSKGMGKISVTGNVADVYTSATGEGGMIAAYNADPTYLIYSGLLLASANGTTNVEARVAVRHEMKTTLQVVDALVS